jgi:hypothetical protein
MKHSWTKEEDSVLVELVAKHGKQWGAIAAHLPDRSASQVAARWEKCLDPRIHKGPFTPGEDQLIVNYVSQNGPRCWPRISAVLPNRSPKQCRERWFNHLSPSVVKTEWSQQEDELLFQQFEVIGGKWSLLSKLFPGRSDNAIKNRWNSSVSRRISLNPQGQKFVLPDASKRKCKTKDRPPPAFATAISVDIPPFQPTPAPTPPTTPVKGHTLKLEIPPSSLNVPIPVTPFTVPRSSGSLLSPVSPGGFQLTPIGLEVLSATLPPFLLSPTKKDEPQIQLS